MPWLLFQVMSNIPKMGQLPTPVDLPGRWMVNHWRLRKMGKRKKTPYIYIFLDDTIGKRYGFLLVNHCSPLLRRLFEYDFHHFWGVFQTSQVSAKLQLVYGIVNIKQLRMISWHRQWLLWWVAAIPTSVTTAPMHSMWAMLGHFLYFLRLFVSDSHLDWPIVSIDDGFVSWIHWLIFIYSQYFHIFPNPMAIIFPVTAIKLP